VVVDGVGSPRQSHAWETAGEGFPATPVGGGMALFLKVTVVIVVVSSEDVETVIEGIVVTVVVVVDDDSMVILLMLDLISKCRLGFIPCSGSACERCG
jgi:UDP-N-acetylmuramyl pentapeptide phosphotransferase/UDP-N-acetylglucosamine-1-phosphate transferase